MIEICERVWLGDCEDANHVTNLVRNGISATLNVAYDITTRPTTCVKRLKVGLVDDFNDQSDLINIAVDVLHNLVASDECVLVHCAAGVSRSAYVIARYLKMKEGISMDEAYKVLLAKKKSVDDHTPLRVNDSE